MKLGFHVHKSDRTMDDAIAVSMLDLRDAGVSLPAAQIFVSGPRTYMPSLRPAERVAIAEYVAARNLPLVIHGAYVDNPWNKDVRRINNVVAELKIAAELGATGVIVHLSAATAANLETVLEQIDAKVTAANLRDPVLWLEINAAKSTPGTYETPAKISVLAARCAACNLVNLRIGLVVDTAHLFSCGVSLTTYDAARDWFEALPVDLPVMIHLNDSASLLGSGKDKHALLTRGGIWGVYADNAADIALSGLQYVLEWATAHGTIVVLERNEGDVMEDVRLIARMGFL